MVPFARIMRWTSCCLVATSLPSLLLAYQIWFDFNTSYMNGDSFRPNYMRRLCQSAKTPLVFHLERFRESWWVVMSQTTRLVLAWLLKHSRNILGNGRNIIWRSQLNVFCVRIRRPFPLLNDPLLLLARLNDLARVLLLRFCCWLCGRILFNVAV